MVITSVAFVLTNGLSVAMIPLTSRLLERVSPMAAVRRAAVLGGGRLLGSDHPDQRHRRSAR
jgi:hypothetical protein